jgi:1-deoxy-D-xylulose-5-phosphate synthase
MLSGGLGTAILEWLNQNNAYLNMKRIGIKDHFVTHGSLPELRKYENIDISSLFNLINQLLS